GLKGLANLAIYSGRIFTLINTLVNEFFKASINHVNSSSLTDHTTNPLIDDTGQHANSAIDDGNGLILSGDDDILSANHRDFQLHRLTYKKV
ncbi:hypothetical protein BY458DRAFT_439392, partial [Sporodiniella umbellata]